MREISLFQISIPQQVQINLNFISNYSSQFLQPFLRRSQEHQETENLNFKESCLWPANSGKKVK